MCRQGKWGMGMHTRFVNWIYPPSSVLFGCLICCCISTILFFLVSYFSVTDISSKKMWRKSRNRKREEYKKEAHEISTLRSYYCVKKKVNMNALAGCER